MHQIDMAPQIFLQHVARQTVLGRFAVLFIAAACVSSPNEAFAEPKHYQVELSAAKNLPACDRPIDFTGMLMHLLAKPLLDPPTSRLLNVRVGKTPAGNYAVDLAGNEVDGTSLWSTHHEFPAETSCFEVLYKAALRASIVMENQAASEEPSTPDKPEKSTILPTSTTQPTCPTPQRVAPNPPKSTTYTRHAFIGAGALVGFGITPDVAIGLQLFAGWRRSPSWFFEAHARAIFPDDTRPVERTVLRVYTNASLAFAPCYQRGSFGACWSVSGGATAFEWIDVRQPRVGFAPFLMTGPRGFLEHSLSNRWSVRVDGDVGIALLGAEIQDDASKKRWRSSPITGNASISLLAWF